MKIIKTFLLFHLLSICNLALSQNKELQDLIIDNTQGIKQEGVTFYNLEGYQVYVMDYKYNFDEKGFKKLKKKVKIPKETDVIDDKSRKNVKVMVSSLKQGEAEVRSKHFLSKTQNGKIKVVGFSTVCERDFEIENEFYNLVINNEVPERIYTPMRIDSIEFANRFIQLGSVCSWRDPRSVQCYNRGQINWSEFHDKTRAEQMIKGQMAVNEDLKMGTVLEDKEVDILFEGKPTKALKRKFKIKLPELIMGGSNILFIYYVVAEVRGTFVACVMSHYEDQAPDGEIPMLLKEVMELK